ncbi:ArsR/SmtB family transcription factor [Leptospira kanakyensis]|uniref:ArsR family transcriptional regulator n=1 Tax=Leptospira kanakyensis TaxID=2484968 RepID=A0A6N4QMS4_9LEPT|nr:metalloregulator ArsR/SmtB family transcription factor [Leptospira kanakyensis]MCW7470724.1 metalloregulator ArsR/SmtB family transcription factor [Leptospira kanakyensis]MCW7481789.1 metalloregulator ArsR/SmtB family transcription factor [Leptospira kanakyensis]TGK54133.1 ArsR family transcriptional regulator [Leptospira kanakyensis]TGK57938.1 ArsR family transcriptional regulator [Leptospira kanakyensis]TGK73635.1 ArsR family transcriptional regulator [Leptospira kanakyensis]
MNTFAVLADDTRRDIVRLVAKNGELTSTEISQNFQMSPPAISQHLKLLKEANILLMKKDAQKRIYSLNQKGMKEMEDWILEIKNLWTKRLDKLDRYVMKLKMERSHDKK